MANNLKYIRTEFGMSLQELGDALGGIARQNVARWESGTRTITEERLKQLSKVFKIPKKYFTEELTDYDKQEIKYIKLKQEVRVIKEFEVDSLGYPISTNEEEKELVKKIMDVTNLKLKEKLNKNINEILESSRLGDCLDTFLKICNKRKDVINPFFLNQVILTLAIYYDVIRVPYYDFDSCNSFDKYFSKELIEIFNKYKDNFEGLKLEDELDIKSIKETANKNKEPNNLDEI